MAEYIELLSELRSQYNCFDEKERPYYEALSMAIKVLKTWKGCVEWLNTKKN